MSLLEEIASKDDLGHPLCNNLRNGSWLGQFMVTRLKSRPATNHLGNNFSFFKYVMLSGGIILPREEWNMKMQTPG